MDIRTPHTSVLPTHMKADLRLFRNGSSAATGGDSNDLRLFRNGLSAATRGADNLCKDIDNAGADCAQKAAEGGLSSERSSEKGVVKGAVKRE